MSSSFGAAFRQKISEPWRGTRTDQGCAILRFEFLVKAELFGLEGIARQMGIQIQVVRAQTQCGAHDNFIEDGGRRIDDKVCAATRAHDRPHVARVCFHHFDAALLPYKVARALRIPVTAPYRVALADQKLRQQ